jgi:hypothetical protein
MRKYKRDEDYKLVICSKKDDSWPISFVLCGYMRNFFVCVFFQMAYREVMTLPE